MTIQTSLSWETHLLSLAREGFDNLHLPTIATLDGTLLTRAYQVCEEMTRENSRTFMLASGLLPSEKRKSIRALYAFCRMSDDIVDRAITPNPESALAAWRFQSLSPHPVDDNPVALAWADTRHKFSVPARYAEQLLEGVASDLVNRRFKTFDELAAYAYRVASTVGLMSMHIIGYSGQEAVPYAVKLGVALQVTNILRDVGEDWQKGRLYLPQDEMVEFSIDENDIAAGKVTPRWRKFMRFQVERVRRLYEEAWPGIAMLDQSGRFAIAAAAGLYEAILTDIERRDYDVFSRRASVSALGKLSRLPGIWLRLQTLDDVNLWFDY
jgi:phytoene synthase